MIGLVGRESCAICPCSTRKDILKNVCLQRLRETARMVRTRDSAALEMGFLQGAIFVSLLARCHK